MGLMTAAIGIMGAGSQIAGGIAGYQEGRYNATVLAQQAGMITAQKELEAAQYDRAIRFTVGKTIARTAGAGLEMSGSPMAVMIDTVTQMEMDKAIGQYNLEVQRRFTLAGASMEKRRGAMALTTGIMGGFSTALQTGAKMMSFDKPSYASTPMGKKTLVAPVDYYRGGLP